MTFRPTRRSTLLLATLSLAVAPLLAAPDAYAVDAKAAQELARQNRCFRCHAVDKEKTGPAWKDVAAKLKSDKDAEAMLIKHLTGKGKDPDHPVAKGSADDVKNLADWILSL
jgi:cytochrome c